MPTLSRACPASLATFARFALGLALASVAPGLALAQATPPPSEAAPDDGSPSVEPRRDTTGTDPDGTSADEGGTSGPTHLPSHTTEGGSGSSGSGTGTSSGTGGTGSGGAGTGGTGTSGTGTGGTGTSRTGTGTTTGHVATGAGTAGAAAPGEEEEEGDGRDVDFLYIELEGGISDVNLIAFRGGDIFGGPGSLFEEIRGTGPFAGLGLGFRVYWIALGARVTYANYQNFDIGNVGGDLTLRLPIPIVEPYARVGFGYAWQGQANYTNPMMSATTVYGWSFDAALGLDIYLTNWFTIGAGAGFNLLNMSRQRDPTMPCMAITDICPGNPGDAVGYQIRGFGQIAFRF